MPCWEARLTNTLHYSSRWSCWLDLQTDWQAKASHKLCQTCSTHSPGDFLGQTLWQYFIEILRTTGAAEVTLGTIEAGNDCIWGKMWPCKRQKKCVHAAKPLVKALDPHWPMSWSSPDYCKIQTSIVSPYSVLLQASLGSGQADPDWQHWKRIEKKVSGRVLSIKSVTGRKV